MLGHRAEFVAVGGSSPEPAASGDQEPELCLHFVSCKDLRTDGLKQVMGMRSRARPQCFALVADEMRKPLGAELCQEMSILGAFPAKFDPGALLVFLRDTFQASTLIAEVETKKQQILHALESSAAPGAEILGNVEALAVLQRTPKFFLNYMRAAALEKMDKLKEAILAAESAIKAHPHSLAARSLRAKCFYRLGDAAKAKEALLGALKLANEHVDFLVQMGEIHFEEGEFKNSESFYRRALKSDATSKAAQAGVIATQLAQGIRPAPADLDYFPSALDLARISNLKGIQLSRAGQHTSAEVLYKNALTYLPLKEHEPKVLFNLGLLKERQGDAAGAQKYYEQATAQSASPYEKAQARLEGVNKKLTK